MKPASCEGPWGATTLISGPGPAVRLGREICGQLEVAERREWLVANGRGSYASGTVPNMLTRGYHGLLVAALTPPLGRTVMLVKTDATITYRGSSYDLFTNRWRSGAIDPAGHTLIERFWLDGTIPVWRFACGDALVEQRIWMEPGEDTTYVRYTMPAAREPATVTVKAIIDYRDYHGRTGAGPWATRYDMIEQGTRITAFPGATPLILRASAGTVSIANQWYLGFDLVRERERGLQDREDHLHAVTFHTEIAPGDSVILTASTDEAAWPDPIALDRRRNYEQGLLDTFSHTRPQGESRPAWVSQLVLAADQFIVARPTETGAHGQTVIAGYHWFGDWGRDTMISLAGLTLVTGRPAVARGILATFAHNVSQGMLPNHFPDQGQAPEYNTVDATLWYFEAVRAYHAYTGDDDFLQGIFPILGDIITHHLRGTRYHITVDPTDGLLSAGEAGVQLTWMDAIVDGQVITPRTGKPVEVNALWYNALTTMAGFAARLGLSASKYQDLAANAHTGFQRFWNPAVGYCFDVLDGPAGNDDRLRPNQLLAVSLPASPLPPERQRLTVDACERFLLTSAGLRTLAPSDPAYHATYCGDQSHRGSAYHQGTVWGWLIGPFVQAHLRVHADPGPGRVVPVAPGGSPQRHGVGQPERNR